MNTSSHSRSSSSCRSSGRSSLTSNSLCYSESDPKMSVKKFEAHKAFYEPMTDSKMYKQMRRAVRPTMPFFLFARHSDTKFYEDYWYLYPEKPKLCDYNSLLLKKKRDSQMSSRNNKSQASCRSKSQLSSRADSRNGSRLTAKLTNHSDEAETKQVLVDAYIDNYTSYHKTENDKSTKFFT